MSPIRTALASALLIFGVTSCSSTVKVKTDSRLLEKQSLGSAALLKKTAGTSAAVLGAFADASVALLTSAKQLESKGLLTDAAGCYLDAALGAREQLVALKEKPGSPAEQELLRLHNSSLSRFAELWATDPRRLTDGPYLLSCGEKQFEIALSADSHYKRHYFDRMVAADAIEEEGMVRKTRAGYGAAIVGIREQRPERAEELKFYPLRGLHLPVTITIDSVQPAAPGSKKPARVTLAMRSPQLQQQARVGGRTFPLAADFSAPFAVILKGRNEASWGLGGFFKADERAGLSGLFLTEPFDSNRIPVILIHGLVSVPIIWRDIIPEMTSDPELSSRYQFMVFTYPSSYPIVQSAGLLREQLRLAREHFDPAGRTPFSRNMVVAGHSMGGILTHTLVVEMGDHLWNQFSDKPFDEIPFSPEAREKIRPLVFFEPDPAVKRAIYFSAPHRGAKMAQKGFAGLISQAAKLPTSILNTTTGVLDTMGQQDLGLKIPFDQSKVTSVQSLEPGAPMVAALEKAPYRKEVIYHSVIGDRGRGDTPNSSDGVVEYWSSHQEGAASELIVPTDHGSYKHPKAIEEFRRILREHAGLSR